MTRAALLACLCACAEGNVHGPKYPSAQCNDLRSAPRDPAAYVEGDPLAALFSDERDTWTSGRCAPLRAVLPPLDDKHDLEEETVKSECDEGSSRVDPSVRLACRAGCFAERRHAALVAAWGRAIRGVSAFDPKTFQRFAKECLAAPTGDRYRALWRCAHVPLPPKSFAIREQDRIEYVENGPVTSTRSVGLEWMRVARREGAHEQALMFTECGGAGSRWDTFYEETP